MVGDNNGDEQIEGDGNSFNYCSNCGATIPDADAGDTDTVSENKSDSQSAAKRVLDVDGDQNISINLTNKNAATAGMVIILIGTLLPWVTVSALGTQASALGIETIALLITLASGIMTYSLWSGEWDSDKRDGVVFISASALLIVLIGLLSPMTLLLSGSGDEVQRAITNPGIGVYVTGVGSILALVGGRQVLDT